MASHGDDEVGHSRRPHDAHHNPYSSASRWRHQESSSFHRHAVPQPGQAREPVAVGTTEPLVNALNSDRVEPDGDGAHAAAQHRPIQVAPAPGQLDDGRGEATAPDGREILCGPLLNYRRMDDGRWHGSVLIVAKGGGREILFQPSLCLQRVAAAVSAPPGVGADGVDASTATAGVNGTAAEGINGTATTAGVNGTASDGINGINGNPPRGGTVVESRRLYSDRRVTFWAFDISVPMERDEAKYEYQILDMRYASPHKPRVNAFFVPAADESMRVMFHSCNGFSVGTDEDAYSGAPLWNDVLRKHARAPFHVMLGGGDQIYNDGIRVDGPLRAWTAIGNPRKRRDFPFPETLRAQCDDYYLQNYIRWYDSKPFAMANGQIPQVNIWDDHDIIDGFGSYVDHFMRCDVFRGIGGTAHKYYMLFQHHMAPPPSTYTSDNLDSDGPDPHQLVDTFVAEPTPDPQYIVGGEPGPYVAEHSYNVYSRLGARIALVGIDARTERTRHQVNYPETYDLIFDRLRNELSAAAQSRQPIKHLILLLGIPIAYPRLTWLENVLRSPVIGPIKFLNRRFGLGGGFFNHFDGSVDLLDDLDDHYTARTHKAERADLVLRLQEIAAQFSVRVTILGGDVHLAALGRFYSNPKLGVPVEEDKRYMVNVVSSAIVNKPPPQAVANLLARRNKIHHLDGDTDETLLDLFDKDPGDANKTANHNKCTMPSRNFATLTENYARPSAPAGQANGDTPADAAHQDSAPASFAGRDGHGQLHAGEVDAGTKHRAASMETHGRGDQGSLDICINVEIDQHDAEGKTEGYGMTVPTLRCEARAPSSTSGASR